jgi:phosphohistidine phosphatase
MQVFLVRHAIAHERNRIRWPNDDLRPLTSSGIRKFRKAAYGLTACLPKGVALLTSPYVRARETATILADAIGRGKPIECTELVSGESTQACFELLRKRKEDAVVIVGHEPDLSNFLSVAVCGDRGRMKTEFKKGGAACIEFNSRVESGRATLKWIMPPRVLRALD